jgi:hypothetical protein
MGRRVEILRRLHPSAAVTEAVAHRGPLLLDQYAETGYSAVVRVEEKLRKTHYLRRAVPTVCAVNEHAAAVV